MKYTLAAALLFAWVVSIPAGHAQVQFGASTGPVAGVGPGSAMTYTGTGLGLSTPLNVTDTLSHMYGPLQSPYYDNTANVMPRPVYGQVANGCFGTCYF